MDSKRGGRILGQGVYGCAFDPPIRCVKPINPKGKIGKLTSIEDATKEFSISQRLQKLPYAEEYFILIDLLCKPQPRTKQTNRFINKCASLEDSKFSNLSQAIMDHGGRPLFQVSKYFTVDDLHFIAQQVLEAGTLLLLAHIVHGDLHANNFLVDDKKHIRMIDFGISWSPESLTLANVHSLIRAFTPVANQQSPECSVISGILEKMPYDTILAEIEEKKAVIQLIYKLTGRTVESQMKELERFTRTSISFREQNWYSFYKLYWTKIDAWSYGCQLLTLFVNSIMNDERASANIDTDTRYTIFLNAVLGLCAMDPGRRLDAAEALELLAPTSKILELPEVKTWLATQKKIRQELLQKIGTQ